MSGETPAVLLEPDVLAWSRLGAVCIGEGCARAQYRRRRCNPCYQAWLSRTPASDRPRPTPAERFAAKVDKRGPDECWPWTGCQRAKGYGQFYVSRERGNVPAHVFAVELATGEQCSDGLEGCHHCDNPPCCNPAHVYYGTRRQNVDDAVSRDRVPRGERSYAAELTEQDVVEIRERSACGATTNELAEEYGLSPTAIRLITRGKRWSHVGGPIRGMRRPGVSRTRRAA